MLIQIVQLTFSTCVLTPGLFDYEYNNKVFFFKKNARYTLHSLWFLYAASAYFCLFAFIHTGCQPRMLGNRAWLTVGHQAALAWHHTRCHAKAVVWALWSELTSWILSNQTGPRFVPMWNRHVEEGKGSPNCCHNISEQSSKICLYTTSSSPMIENEGFSSPFWWVVFLCQQDISDVKMEQTTKINLTERT